MQRITSGVTAPNRAEPGARWGPVTGMTRAAAITHARHGAEKLWAGTAVVEPNAKTGQHHHGDGLGEQTRD